LLAKEHAVGVSAARQRLMDVVEERLLGFLDAERAQWSSVDERTAVVIDAVADLVKAGGKRIRPLFCLSGYLAAGGDPDDQSVVPAAVALELLHACALIHDDVMDESELRRGAPTVHVKHAAEHDGRNWRGEPRRFGESVAILAGDLALIYADRIMADAPPVVDDVWGELRSELIIGQFMDVTAAAEFSADPELSCWIAVAKSGRYTIHRPLAVGATIAGRPELAEAFEAYGTALGEAFQLSDDLLDVFGSSTATGKPAGLDFAQHKMTLLLALAMQRDERVRELVSGDVFDAGALRARLVDSGVRADVEKHLDVLVERGCRAIADVPLEPGWREELIAMAHAVVYRDR
jgi:geranylgeranyl diphosphate synthase type I